MPIEIRIGDPTSTFEIFQAIVAICEAGVTMLLEQRRSESLEIADIAVVLQTGRVVLQGKAGRSESSRYQESLPRF
jgi:ABC-type branched-subunit amino acid transport system ATPase component